MAVTVTEKEKSRERVTGEGASTELLYTILGTGSDVDAEAAVRSTAPVLYAGLSRKNVRVKPVFVDVNNPDTCIWEGIVQYARAVRPDTGDSVYSFDIGGGTEHITQSIATVGRYARQGQTARNYRGAIGVTGASTTSPARVEGVSIPAPVYDWSERHYLDDVYVTGSYKAALFWLTRHPLNQMAFRGFEPGEVMFRGANGGRRGQDDWEIAFHFSASPNLVDLVVGEITGIKKGGWDYLWIRYVDEPDEESGLLVTVPEAVYVEQVLYYGDFTRLGIGI